MYQAFLANNYDGIRQIFSAAQAHNDAVRNGMGCYSGPEVHNLIAPLGNPGPIQPMDVIRKIFH
jgi:hypothetical protein